MTVVSSPVSATRISGTVLSRKFFSPALGVEKHYRIYLPPGYAFDKSRRYPVLYLFRGHEDEWFNPYQDHSRGGTAIQDLLDELIGSGTIGEMIVVGPGMTSDDGEVFGLGVDFLNPDAARKHNGVGNGKFEAYFVRDFVEHIENTYRVISNRRARGADGFSLGGYTAVMLAIRHPELFSSVGSYDGSHMFLDMKDPRLLSSDQDDRLWLRNDGMFAPAFRRPGQRKYTREHLLAYNPLNILQSYGVRPKKRLQNTEFYIKTAAFDGGQGNRDRGVHLVTLFQLYGIPNDANGLILSNDAHHTWKFADLHMRETLKKHAENFGIEPLKPPKTRQENYLTNLEIINVWEPGPLEREVQSEFRIYQKSNLKVEVISRNGNYVTTLADQVFDCGHHTLTWDGSDALGHLSSSGVYFLQFNIAGGVIRHRCVFLRR